MDQAILDEVILDEVILDEVILDEVILDDAILNNVILRKVPYGMLIKIAIGIMTEALFGMPGGPLPATAGRRTGAPRSRNSAPRRRC